MTLNLIGAEGLFTRIGHLIYGVNNIVNEYRGTTLSNRVDLIQRDYANSDQSLIDGIYSQLSSTQNSHTAMINYWKRLAQNTVTQMINSYQPQYRNDYRTALGYLYNYLVTNHENVVQNTVSTTVTPNAGNNGDGVVLARPYTTLGSPQEYMFNEPVSVLVTRDYRNGATPGQETLQFTGIHGTTDPLHWLWPQGSNALLSLIAISPDTIGGSGTKNWLPNGSMERFTTNVPDFWHIHTGTAGTTVLQDLVTFYDGISSLRLVGNGTEKTALWTQFGVDFGGGAVPSDQLVVNLWYNLGSVPAAGVLMVSLVDGTGTTLVDSTGSPVRFSSNLTSSGSMAWRPLNGFIRMPPILPAQVYLMISLDTPLSTGVTLNLDRIALARPSLFYPGGPLLAGFSGNNQWLSGDTFTVQAVNNFNGLIQSGCNQLLDLSNYGLMLPSTTGVATIPNSLVV